MTDTPNTTQGKGAVDWSRPIEAVHEDGRVAAVELDPGYSQPDNDGEYALRVGPPGHEMSDLVHGDGRSTDPDNPWRIRNVPEHPTPTQYAPELVERMVAFVRQCARGFYYAGVNEDAASAYEIVRGAKSIVSDLPQEIDPDLIEARERLNLSFVPRTDEAEALALACIKRGRQLERGDAA